MCSKPCSKGRVGAIALPRPFCIVSPGLLRPGGAGCRRLRLAAGDLELRDLGVDVGGAPVLLRVVGAQFEQVLARPVGAVGIANLSWGLCRSTLRPRARCSRRCRNSGSRHSIPSPSSTPPNRSRVTPRWRLSRGVFQRCPACSHGAVARNTAPSAASIYPTSAILVATSSPPACSEPPTLELGARILSPATHGLGFCHAPRRAWAPRSVPSPPSMHLPFRSGIPTVQEPADAAHVSARTAAHQSLHCQRGWPLKPSRRASSCKDS